MARKPSTWIAALVGDKYAVRLVAHDGRMLSQSTIRHPDRETAQAEADRRNARGAR